MKNLNPLYEDVWYPGTILGGAVGGGAGFLLSKLINKYFIETDLQKLKDIKNILLNTDSFSEFQNKVISVDPKFSVVLKQYEKYPNWKETILNLLDKKIRQKIILKAGVKGLGTAGGAVAGGIIGNNLEPNKPLPAVSLDDLPFEVPESIKNRKTWMDYLNNPDKNRSTILDILQNPDKYKAPIPYSFY